jgi:hypothetical protein
LTSLLTASTSDLAQITTVQDASVSGRSVSEERKVPGLDEAQNRAYQEWVAENLGGLPPAIPDFRTARARVAELDRLLERKEERLKHAPTASDRRKGEEKLDEMWRVRMEWQAVAEGAGSGGGCVSLEDLDNRHRFQCPYCHDLLSREERWKLGACPACIAKSRGITSPNHPDTHNGRS